MMLGVAHLNVRSLLGNFADFCELVRSVDADIFGVTETWLGASVSDCAVSVPGYQLIRKDRCSRGGGVAIYLRNCLKFTVIPTESFSYIEQLWLNVALGSVSLCVGTIYRPPNTNMSQFFDSFNDTLADVDVIGDFLICMGDCNIDMLNDNYYTLNFNSILHSFALKQIITEPTRISRGSASLLDIIIMSDNLTFYGCSVSDVHALSDHCLVRCGTSVPINNCSVVTRACRSFRRFDLDLFREHLNLTPWYSILEIEALDDKLHMFYEYISLLFDVHAPVINIMSHKRGSSPWLTDNIRLLMSLRNKALKSFKASKSPNHWNEYKSLRNFTSSAIKREKKAWLQHRLQNFGKKTIWKDLHKLNIYNRGSTNIPAHLLDVNDLNNYFSSASDSSGTCDPEVLHFYNSNIKPGVDTFSFGITSDAEVADIISHMSSNSAGIDGLSLRMLSLCCPTVLPILTHIFDICLQDYVFPSAWKLARVIPVPKNRNPSSYNDLRPISIVSVLSKILEKIVDRQLRSHLSRFHILPSFQSGFRPGFSCASALASITDDIISANDMGLATVLVLLDFSKAFDKINHNLLLSILHYIGLDDNAVRFFNSYLDDRWRRVVVGGSESASSLMRAGVPQGSILGPLLFSIYTSNLFFFHNFTCNFHLYADDSQLYRSFPVDDTYRAIDDINCDLDKLFTIASKHCLHLNIDKSYFLIFGGPKTRSRIPRDIKLRINNICLSPQKNVRNLGLYMDCELRFKHHVSTCIKRAYCNLKLIYPHRHVLDIPTKKLLCDSLVLSHFNFCDSIYGSCLDQLDIRRIQCVQNACLRLIFSIRKHQRISHKLVDAGWLNMVRRRRFHTLCFIYKVMSTATPPYLFYKITFRTDVHNINIRRKDLLDIPKHRTQQFKRCFRYTCASLFNSLPFDVRRLPYRAFRHSVFNLLMDEQHLCIGLVRTN